MVRFSRSTDAALRVYTPAAPVWLLGERIIAAWMGQSFAEMGTGVLGVLALLLAILGLFAMMAYTVVQRRSEFGIRMTFGATPESIRWPPSGSPRRRWRSPS